MRWEALLSFALLATAAPTAAAGYVLDDDGMEDPTENQPGHTYHTWETLTVDLQQLVNQNSDIARLHPGGESVLGFDLWVVEIANFGDDNRTPLDQREVVWLDGGTHANEQLGTELAYEWIEFLLTGYGENDTATWIVDNRHTFVMPMVNPDGNHKDSRANARQVDLNRNYPVGWGELDENRPPVGPGSYPLSEPETRTIVEWWEKTEPDYVNSLHTGIELMLYPPGYEEREPRDKEVYRRICEEIGEPDPEFCGPIYSTIYPAAGGSIDTSYARYGAVSFSYEVSSEQNLYASVEDPRTRLERYWDGIEHASLNVEKYGAHPVIQSVAIGDSQLQLTVENDGYGNLTQGHVTVSMPGNADTTVELPRIPHGETATVTADIQTEAGGDGRIEATLTYQERKVGEPMETRTHPLPVAIEDGSLSRQPLDVNVTDEPLEPQSEDATSAVPAPGALAAMLVLGALALVHRHRQRGRGGSGRREL